jgi:hypothetical protein
MAIRYYIVPNEEKRSDPKSLGPKYFYSKYTQTGLNVEWSGMDYGAFPWMIVRTDLTTQQHNDLVANADVVALPADISQQIGPTALNTVQTALENRNIPSGWVTQYMTYRTLLRICFILFQLAQRYNGLHLRTIIESGYTLDSTISELPQEARDRLIAMAASFNFDTYGITGTTTIRQAFKHLIDQWDKDIIFGGEVI